MLEVKNVSAIYVQGSEIAGTFDVMAPSLKWTEGEADEFFRLIIHAAPDVYRNTIHIQPLSDDEHEICPDRVIGLGFYWHRKLEACEPRENLEAEFASRQESVFKLLSEQLSKVDST